MIFNLKRLTLGAIATSLLLGTVACQSATTPDEESTSSTEGSTSEMPGDGVTITSAHSSASEERFQTEIVNRALQALGYETEEPLQLAVPAMFLALADGELDYTAVHWEGNQTELYESSGGEEKLAKLNTFVDNALQGYQIDKKTADAQSITNLEQLKDPEVAKLFDTDGNGKANLVGCDPGWACEVIIEHHLEAYGLNDTVEQDKGQYNALITDAITRYEQGEPVLFYTWTPFWLSALLEPGEDTVWLGVPFTDLPDSKGEVTEELTTTDGINLGFAGDRMKIVANQQFATDNPAAKKLFEIVEISVEDVSAQNRLMYDGEDSIEDVDRHVDEWIDENQETFDAWVEEAQDAS